MTAYTDIPEANTLYGYRQAVGQAIEMLDAGGGVTNLTVAPAMNTVMPAPGTSPTTPPLLLMPVSIIVPLPNTEEFLVALREWLVVRANDLDQQLAALGVEATPPQVR